MKTLGPCSTVRSSTRPDELSDNPLVVAQAARANPAPANIPFYSSCQPIHITVHIGGVFRPDDQLEHPEKYCIHYLKQYFLDQSINETFYSVLAQAAQANPMPGNIPS